MITPRPKPPIIRNIVIDQIKPEQLHAHWAWLKRGALDILAKVGAHTDWIPEDLYAALRYPQASSATCFMVSRNQKALGWVAGEMQRDRYGRLEWFLWCAWDIPLVERLAEDDVEGARDQLVDYLKLWARSQGCHRISCLSSRRLEYLGWQKGHTVFYLPL